MRRLKTGRRPPIYPKTPGHLPCSSLTHPLPLPSRRPSVSFGGFGLRDSGTPDIDGVAIEWTTLVAGTDYVANSARDGSGTDMTSSLTLTVEYLALSLDMDLIENTSSQTIYLTKLQARGKVVADEGDSEEFDYRSDSIANYGRRTYAFPAGFITDRQEARGFIAVLLAQTVEAHPKVSLEVNPNLSDGLLEKVLELEVSDRVTVIATDVSHLGLDQDMYIETINHDITAPGIHRTRYVLSSALASGVENVIVLNVGPGLGTGVLGR